MIWQTGTGLLLSAFELWLGDAGAWHVAERAEVTENQAQHNLTTQQCPLGAAGILSGRCDAIYFDLFSPETQPDLWTLPVFRTAASALRPDGRLTCYCVKITVHRGLQGAGLTVAKSPGPLGGKREVLIATR